MISDNKQKGDPGSDAAGAASDCGGDASSCDYAPRQEIALPLEDGDANSQPL